MTEPLTPGATSLASLDRDVDRLRLPLLGNVETAIDEFLSLDTSLGRIACLSTWELNYPRATNQLLTVVAKHPPLAAKFAPTVVAQLSRLLPGDLILDAVDELLVTAFPTLAGPWRDAAAERALVRKEYKLVEGVDFQPVRPADSAWLWPGGRPFPRSDTVDGVQARLNFLDYGAGPVTGEWTPMTRRALARWQIHAGLEPTGDLDDDTIDRLNEETPSSPT